MGKAYKTKVGIFMILLGVGVITALSITHGMNFVLLLQSVAVGED